MPSRRNGLRFGGDYSPEQWTQETWLDDVRLMREARIDTVSLGIFVWALLEPREGEYDFALLDELVELLADAGIDIDLATPTAAPPAWFWAAHPDARPVTRDGTVLGHGSRGIASPSSPDYRRAAAAITTRLAERYGRHPAVVLWHVHNEYGAPVGESYDEHSVRAFRAWLQRRYGDLDRLNAAWGTTFWGQTYGDWEQLDAPRASASVVNPAQRLDFARFSSDALLECFVAERDIIHRLSPGVPVTTNFMASSCPAIDYWRWAREVDVVANDHYLSGERRDAHVALSLDADLTRSLAGGAPWLLLEHSSSAVNWQPRNIAKRPGELARNSFAHIARSSDSAMFFQVRASRFGAEKFHSGLIPHAGTGGRLWREVVEFGSTLGRLAEVVGSRTVDAAGSDRARVAILWDVESFWAQDLEWRPSIDARHRDRIEAVYGALWHRNVTVDFAHPAASLDRYDLVIAPALYLVTADSAANLRHYVESGGTLLVSFFSGIVDATDTLWPGPYPGALREVLGLRIEQFLPLRGDETVRLDSGARGAVWCDEIVTEGATVLARYLDGPAAGGAAITSNAFGAGRAVYASTDLDVTGLGSLLDELLAAAGISGVAAPAGLEVVRRRSPAADFVFAINHAETAASIPLGPGTELVTGAPATGTLDVPAGSVRVVRIERQPG